MYANHRCFSRISSKSYQGFPLKNAVACVESQNGDRHCPNLAGRFDESSLQPKVQGPFILSWIEEPDEFTGTGKDGSKIRPLVTIAEKAGKCQIVFFSGTAMFQADDMIHFATKEGVLFVDQAVLAESVGTRNDQLPE